MTVPCFETRNVYVRYGRQVVLRDVSLQVNNGESVALLGANGAGKSTLLRLLATLGRPTRGVVIAFGSDIWESRDVVRERIGVVGHQPYIYPELTCNENLRFFATMYGLNPDAVIVPALAEVGLSDRRDSPAGTLSRGLLQRLNVARARLHQPQVLLLDEPDTGLDREGREVLAGIVRSHTTAGGTVVFTTHSYEYGLQLASRVVVLREGSVSLDRPRDEVSGAELDDAIAIRHQPAGVGE